MACAPEQRRGLVENPGRDAEGALFRALAGPCQLERRGVDASGVADSQRDGDGERA